MAHDIEQLLQKLKLLHLTTEEKQVMRQSLVVAQTPIGAPSPRVWFAWHYRLVAGLVVLVILVGGSLSVAAEQALPGELLYPIKTKVNEPVATWLSPKKADREAKIIDTRLTEAETLDQEGKLTEPLKSEVKQNIVKQAAKTAQEEGRESDQKQIVPEKKMEAVVQKHEEILQKLEIKDQNVDKKEVDHGKIQSERSGSNKRH